MSLINQENNLFYEKSKLVFLKKIKDIELLEQAAR